MPPKTEARRASSSKRGDSRGGRRGSSPSPKGERKKSVSQTAQKKDVDYMGTLNHSAKAQEWAKYITVMTKALNNGSEEVVKAGMDAAKRSVNRNAGFFAFGKAGGFDIVRAAAQGCPDQFDPSPEAADAWQVILCKGESILQNTDHIDFPEIPKVMEIAMRLGGDDEHLAIALIDCMSRFTMHRIENAVLLLDQAALPSLHRMLVALRAPAVCEEVMVLLYRMCDLPGDKLGEYLAAEKEIIRTITDTLRHAPFNIGMQIAGLRVLAMWQRLLPLDQVPPVKGAAEVRAVMSDVDVRGCLRESLENLESAGFAHASSWLAAMAGDALGGIAPPRRTKTTRLRKPKEPEEVEPKEPEEPEEPP